MTWGYRTPEEAAAKRKPWINAHIEKAMTGRNFRHMFREGRVIVPAGGWFEWTVENGKKQPRYITRPYGSMSTTTWQDLLNPGGARDFFARREFPPFDPEAGAEYSRTNALWLAELSRLFYRQDVEEVIFAPQPSRASFLEKAGLKQRAFFASVDMDTHAMLVEPVISPSFAILVFRGTDSKRDYVTDMECGTLPWDQNKAGVHKGFRKALDSVWDEIEKALSQLICPIFYTGHSLGAALATLAAARYAPRAVYTFGSPRVGNEAFATSLQTVPIHRVVDNKDAAALFPPEAMGFRHVGLLQLLTEPQAEGEKTSFLELLNIFKRPPRILADHAPVNYVDRA